MGILFCFPLPTVYWYISQELKLKYSIMFLCIASSNAMAERQGSGGVAGQIHWISAMILMLSSHHISGQGQGK